MSLFSTTPVNSATKFCFLVEQSSSPQGLVPGVATKCYDSLYANLDKISINSSESFFGVSAVCRYSLPMMVSKLFPLYLTISLLVESQAPPAMLLSSVSL